MCNSYFYNVWVFLFFINNAYSINLNWHGLTGLFRSGLFSRSQRGNKCNAELFIFCVYLTIFTEQVQMKFDLYFCY